MSIMISRCRKIRGKGIDGILWRGGFVDVKRGR